MVLHPEVEEGPPLLVEWGRGPTGAGSSGRRGAVRAGRFPFPQAGSRGLRRPTPGPPSGSSRGEVGPGRHRAYNRGRSGPYHVQRFTMRGESAPADRGGLSHEGPGPPEPPLLAASKQGPGSPLLGGAGALELLGDGQDPCDRPGGVLSSGAV